MKFLFFLILISYSSIAQISESPDDFIGRLKTGAPVPEKLLSTRSIVIYPHSMTEKELKDAQKSFQQTGIDAVAYFEMDMLLAGEDVANALARYFNVRDIVNLVIFQKDADKYSVYITGFNTKENFVEKNQVAWSGSDPSFAELLKKVYRAAAIGLTRKNFLINDYPETDLEIDIIRGRRSEFFAIDLKVDNLAVPKTGDAEADKYLETLFSTYPYKYALTEPGLSERELRSQGYLYVLHYVHARGSLAKNILGYDISKHESAYVSVTFPDGEPVLKNIPAEKEVYKFYFKHIESGNVFLGTKWDADVTWQQALRNHMMAFKSELKIN